MLASIVLDQSYPHYTNLDYISGKVYVRTPTSTTVSSIVVKLEGESRTRLLPPPNPSNDRQKPQLEFHKILYKTQAVFPPTEIAGQQGAAGSSSGKTAYTLPAGQHEYPFRFKFPFNNACDPSSNSNPTISLFGGLNVEMYKTPHMHVKKTLPPTLVGFPGEAEIRYYVKATVNRPSLFKENARAYVPFNFCPIEPPRPPPSEALGYARRRHQFNAALPTTPTAAPSKSKMASFFGGSKKAGATSSGATTPTAPFVAVDLRLPEPAILTCAKPVPARVVVTSLNGTTTGMTIVSLQLEVVSITKVRAQDVGRVERGSTVLFSRSGMSVPLQFGDGAAKDASATQAKETEPEAEVDSRLWTDQPLPNVVPPSFETCNITRTYEIFARIGIRYDVAGSMPQTTTIDLRLPVQIFSGITPPPELLDAMARAQAQNVGDAAPPIPPRPGPNGAPPLPSRKPLAAAAMAAPPPQPHEASGEEPPYGDAPPSYEDAVAADVQPMEGIQRADYAPPAAAEDPLLDSGRAEKSGWH